MSESQFNSARMDVQESLLNRSSASTNEIAPVTYRECLEIDMTNLGGRKVYVTSRFQDGYNPETNESGFFMFQGNRHYYVPYESDGWEWNGNGSLPSPTLTITDFNGDLLNDIYQHQNLIGAKVKRWLVRDEYNYRGPEEFIIIQKSESTSTYHKFRLGTILAARNMKIPARNMFRDEFPGMQRLR